MGYYPIAIELEDRLCLVVGGGTVALRKVEALLECGARVKVVSPQACAGIEALAASGRIELENRTYRLGDIEGKTVVIAATDDASVNRQVSQDACEANVLVNVVDMPELSSFIVPATVRRGDLTIAIFTGGRSPGLARRLREQLEQEFGPEYGDLVALLGELREEVKRRYPDQKDREAAMRRLLDLDLLADLRAGNRSEARRKAIQCI